jgi:hypothetical protein
MTLLMEIEHAKKHLHMMQQRVKEQEQVLKELEDLRAECPHEWDEGTVKYEHEGRNCKLCGINELFAPTHAKWVEAKKS